MPTRHGYNAKERLLQFDLREGGFKSTKTKLIKQNPKAVIYCRVSSNKQVADGNGLRSQEMSCRAWCEKQEPPIEVEAVFMEPGISGKNSDRKEFNRLLCYLEKMNADHTHITHFIAYEHSRISRPEDQSEGLQMEAKVKQYGTKIVTLDCPYLDDTTDEGMLMKQLHYGLSGYERKKIARGMLNGRINRMKDGYRPFGRVPV